MRRALLSALAASGLAALRGEATATPLFVSPPHFRALSDRYQLVFFLNEPVVGALAARTTDGTIEVIVPQARVDPTLDGAVFPSDEWPGRNASVRVVGVMPGGGPTKGAAIRIAPGMPVETVDAYPVEEPPRLIVELSLVRLTPTPRPTPRGPARTISPPVSASAAPASPNPAAPALSALPPTGSESPTASATPPDDRGAAAPAPAATPAAGLVDDTAAPAAKVAAPSTQPAMPCHYRRVSGVAFCAPASDAVPYTADAALAAVAGALRERDEVPPELPAETDGPAALYLAADVEFVRGAPARRLLSAVDAYRRALRRYPAFLDAPRARLNIALAYDAMGLALELGAAAAAAGGDPGAPLALALVGDSAAERGELDRADQAYVEVAAEGGLGVCLAARGRVRLALTTGEAGEAEREQAGLARLCPSAILDDPETERLRARVRVASGDARQAIKILSGLRDAFGPAGAAPVIEDLALAAVAAGDLAEARSAYTELAGGRHGARATARATIGLARLDAQSGDFAAALRRLDALPPVQAEAERYRLGIEVVSAALARGADAEAVAAFHQQGIRPDDLSPADQIRLAASYHALGLAAEGERLIAQARVSLGADASDALWEALATSVLAQEGGRAALEVIDEWQRARDGKPPRAALALRARALAAQGDVAGALALSSGPLAEADPAAARDVRIEIATLLSPHDPARAVELLRAALTTPGIPEPPAARVAAAWRVLAEAAEVVGDDATVIEAFTQLSMRYGDQLGADGAAYRAARLAAGKGAGADAYEQATKSADAVTRRVAQAVRAYEDIVAPLEAIRFEALETEMVEEEGR